MVWPWGPWSQAAASASPDSMSDFTKNSGVGISSFGIGPLGS